MKWRDLISGVYAMRGLGDGTESKAVFHPPVSIQELADLESQLKTKLPTDLRSLLLETNGVMDMLKIRDSDWFENIWLLWPISKIIEENLYFRGEKARTDFEHRFDNLLFFANAGSDGLLFAHSVNAERLAEPSVVAWFPIDDELAHVAPSLGDFLEGWLMNKIIV